MSSVKLPAVRSMLDTFQAARRVSTPIIAIRTTDQNAIVARLQQELNGTVPLALWDIVRGVSGLNAPGKKFVKDNDITAVTSTNPVEALTQAQNLPEDGVMFMLNAHRIIEEFTVAQGIWNTREPFKANGRTLVLLCPDIVLPAELQPDVLVIDDELPTPEQLRELVLVQHKAAGLPEPDETVQAKAVDALVGLSMFPAEQVVAMSLKKTGLVLNEVWERKRQSIEQAPGLSVYRGRETFEDIGGCANFKSFALRILAGPEGPGGIGFIDELEKHMAGTSGDTSGVSGEMHGQLLTWMQDKRATGILCVGPPGAAKSACAKAMGNTAGVPTIQIDLSGMKSSLVGSSGANLRNALKVVDAVTQGRALFIATCNSMANLSPELLRRFSFGIFFFDLPTPEERALIWALYLKKYDLKPALVKQLPDDTDWTGAEIQKCCDLAWRLNVSLVEAAKYIVPVARSAQAQITKLRESANGKYISAAEPGVYEYAPLAKAVKGRKISLGN